MKPKKCGIMSVQSESELDPSVQFVPPEAARTTAADPIALARKIGSRLAGLEADVARFIEIVESESANTGRRNGTRRVASLCVLRSPTPDELLERERLWREYELLTLQLGVEIVKERSPDTKNFFAAQCRSHPSEISRWLPPSKPGRKREIPVGSATDDNIRAALNREIVRMQALLSNCLGKLPISNPAERVRPIVEA
jgi:hypothetical protein